jgi:hypothetical protein
MRSLKEAIEFKSGQAKLTQTTRSIKELEKNLKVVAVQVREINKINEEMGDN